MIIFSSFLCYLYKYKNLQTIKFVSWFQIKQLLQSFKLNEHLLLIKRLKKILPKYYEVWKMGVKMGVFCKIKQEKSP